MKVVSSNTPGPTKASKLLITKALYKSLNLNIKNAAEISIVPDMIRITIIDNNNLSKLMVNSP